MAREGYFIIDSDMHFNEPDDLWTRYLEGPHRANPPQFFGGQKQQLTKTAEDKGSADAIRSAARRRLIRPKAYRRRGRISSWRTSAACRRSSRRRYWD